MTDSTSTDLDNFLNNWTEGGRIEVLGEHSFTSSHINICDPLGLAESEGENEALKPHLETPTGVFPVKVKQATDEHGNLINQFMWVEFSKAELQKWEQLKTLNDQYPFDCFACDYGHMTFMDDALRQAFQSESEAYEEPYDGWLCDYLEDNVIATIPLKNGTKVIACEAPGGNGEYAAFLGFDVNGKACRLVIDFYSPYLEL